MMDLTHKHFFEIVEIPTSKFRHVFILYVVLRFSSTIVFSSFLGWIYAFCDIRIISLSEYSLKNNDNGDFIFSIFVIY